MPDSRLPNLPAVPSTPTRSAEPSVGEDVGFQVVGIGASAGGLEACTRFLDAMPAGGGRAYIFVQHLDPVHESLLVGLLAAHTPLTVVQAAEGMKIEPDHLYIIPPAAFLFVADGALHLKPTHPRRGARLPFDMLLLSMAKELGKHAIAVVMSGSGTDGSAGVVAIKRGGGLVIAQQPDEAAFDGMPRSAIATGAVDRVVAIAEMPRALATHGERGVTVPATIDPAPMQDTLSGIIALLRTNTTHDFTLYKPGTLQRRIERRMAMAAIGIDEMGRYLTNLRSDPAEIERLATDLLINVTGFFRDPAVFDVLAETVLPDLLREHLSGDQLRFWIAGCSTGEEAYSLAMLFQEQAAATHSAVRLQIFASDADAEAVAVAREGLYPATIEADVTPARMARFFIREDQGFRISPELRAMVVFTVHDLLTDPPFSRLDLVSCRNVMIYLGAEAQRRAVALFHFALRKGGVLLLGSAEGVGDASGRFEVISKPARLYRRIGRNRPGDVNFAKSAGESVQIPVSATRSAPPSRQLALVELCRRHALDTHAPATVLSNRKHECLYFLGPIERYLRMAPGHATLDVLAMVRQDFRARLRSAILRALQDNAPVIVDGGRTVQDGRPLAFNIEVHPILNDDEELLLIYFVDRPARQETPGAEPADAYRIVELERELATTRAELQGAVRSLEISGDEQKATVENALSVNEEFQSTNEELLTSKEELQSLNEELTALNSQLQETLEQQRTTSDDLQNVLYSTDVATVFLDSSLRIRFFTPATKSLFSVIKTDVGRPLADLHSLAADAELPADARSVLKTLSPIEREIETPGGVWCRRILPYRAHDNAVEGVVITFTDITGRRHAAEALEAAKREAEQANAAKSRFLAAASHDLRQPLQTLALLQGLLARLVEGTESRKLVIRLDDTVSAMSGMLNSLLDINQIEAGEVHPQPTTIRVDDLLERIRGEFSYHAQAQGLKLRVIRSGVNVRSDPRLLEQMLRNLVSNALKYTDTGKILLGCRRGPGLLRIEVWDTGIGIAESELASIFEEYHQLGNAAHERGRGFGLGLSIVHRLSKLLGHPVQVRSWPGKGSVFSIEVPTTTDDPSAFPARREAIKFAVYAPHHDETVLVVEDDPTVRELLKQVLSGDGYDTMAATDGPAALDLVARGLAHPNLLLSDYDLPKGMDGLQVTAKLREKLGAGLPSIILTGDISLETSDAIDEQSCVQLSKPVTPVELIRAVSELLPSPPTAVERAAAILRPARPSDGHVIFVVDDDLNIREAVRLVLEADGRTVEAFASGEAFLAAYRPGSDGCLLIDAYLPGMGGLDLLRQLRAAGDRLPAIMITGSSDVPMAVQAMKAGAADFIEKPIRGVDLLSRIGHALERSADSSKLMEWRESAAAHVANLTPRQHQIMDLVLAGHPSKNIATDLGISQRTVENHRASIMKTTGTKSLPALARLALAAEAPNRPSGEFAE